MQKTKFGFQETPRTLSLTNDTSDMLKNIYNVLEKMCENQVNYLEYIKTADAKREELLGSAISKIESAVAAKQPEQRQEFSFSDMYGQDLIDLKLQRAEENNPEKSNELLHKINILINEKVNCDEEMKVPDDVIECNSIDEALSFAVDGKKVCLMDQVEDFEIVEHLTREDFLNNFNAKCVNTICQGLVLDDIKAVPELITHETTPEAVVEQVPTLETTFEITVKQETTPEPVVEQVLTPETTPEPVVEQDTTFEITVKQETTPEPVVEQVLTPEPTVKQEPPTETTPEPPAPKKRGRKPKALVS